MKVKQSKKKQDFQNMSLDNFFDNMDADVADEEPDPKPKSKLKANGIKKVKKKVTKENVETKKQQPVVGKAVKSKVSEKQKKLKVASQEPTPAEGKKSKPKQKSNGTGEVPKPKRKEKKPKKELVSKEQKPKRKAVEMEPEDSDDGSDVAEGNGMAQVEKDHKTALAKLQQTDPELYAFLKKNDEKLLKFGKMANDGEMEFSGTDDDDEEDEDELEDEEEKIHRLPSKLEVASDESDFEPDDDDGSDDDEGEDDDGEDDDEGVKGKPSKSSGKDVTPGKKLNFKMLKAWTTDLTTLPVKQVEPIRNICKAFNSAIYTVTGEKTTIPPFRVDGSGMFNAIVQTCVLYLGPAIQSYLRVSESRQFKDLKRDKRFTKVRGCLRAYLIDLTNLLENVSSAHIMTVLLKHLHQFSPILVCYQHITKPILKRLIGIWGTAEEETVRVLAFLCILKITHAQQSRYLSNVLKAMYLVYVKNSKFVSPNTLPNINFMRRSLTEMFLLNFNLSYQHMFLYIRQLAIHLRNAVILQKKDSYRYIYNWQYINSLKLWGDVLGAAHTHGDALEPLVYPYVSITIGVIKLIPSAQYFPLRFHCCRMLTQLSAKTRAFIPVLPFLVEVLKSNTFNQQHKKLSMRPVNLACLLRFSPANIQENAFKDAVLDQIYELVLEYAANESSSVAFPEIVLPSILLLRQYAKSTKQYKYARKIKQLSDKLMENYEFMEKWRKQMNLPLKDTERIRAWEEMVRAEGTPLARFHATVAKLAESEKRRQATDSEKISDYKLPTVKRPEKRVTKRTDGPVTLFPSDDEDDEDDELGFGKRDEESGDSDDESEMEVEDEDSEADEVAEDKVAGKGKSKLNGTASKKKQTKSAPVADATDVEYPLERDDDTDQVDIVQDLKLDEWED
ncbi:nucleolar complex protein 2 homolog [Anopheles bellator]|uniref:nucleolar complex protein 2 homolog n=1 Tax=Anopheles bellator TaxID=139047 RepID=UPI002648F980|nr:nucleolar complex protein 2 homolog [Anopheles bellator]